MSKSTTSFGLEGHRNSIGHGESEPDGDMPAKQLVLGFDRHGRLLEMAVLTFDSGNQLVIHAMKARSRFLRLLD